MTPDHRHASLKPAQWDESDGTRAPSSLLACPFIVPALPPRSSPKLAARNWIAFIAAIAAAFFVHEIGHCVVAWFHGYPAIPTPLKEYLLKPVPVAIQQHVALGGIVGSVVALLAGALFVSHRPGDVISAAFAGALAVPGFYTLRFILAGRGHDATEFQEAQATLGLSYAGHALDWFFLALFGLAAAFWFWRSRAPATLRLAGRLALGALVALTAVVLLQSANNAVFDPLLARFGQH